MSTRVIVASLLGLVGFASPALAFHPKGGNTYFYGLTWGRAPSGGGGVPRTFGAPSGTQSFGVVPFGVQSFGVQSFGVMPFGASSFGAAPFGVRPVTDVEAQGIQDWFNLILRGTQCIGGMTGGGGIASRDLATLNTSVQGLKTELAALRATNEKILAELRQIRKGDKTDPPVTKKSDSDMGDNRPPEESRAPKLSPPTYANVDRDLNDIAAMQKQLAEKEAKMDKLRAARKPAPNGTGVATTNR